MEAMLNEPFMVNPSRRPALPPALIKRLYREGVPKSQVFQKAWQLFRRGKTNPGELLLINKPEKRGGVSSMIRKRRGLHRIVSYGRKGQLKLSSFPRLHSSGGLGLNPFEGLALNRRRHYGVRSYRGNPAGLGGIIPKPAQILSAVKDSVIATGGFIGVKMVPNYLFPAQWRVGAMGYASKGITAIGLSVIANKVLGKKVGDLFLMGGLIAITSELAGELLLKVGGSVGDALSMGVYMPELSAYIGTDNRQ